MNILFLCTGNVSRSYLAEMFLKHEIKLNHVEGISVASAGTLDNPGMPADPVMTDCLTKLNIPTGNHLSRKVTEKDVEWADRILVMENRHREFIRENWPDADYKVERLGKYISPDQIEDDIIDPYGKSPSHYRVVQFQIESAIKSLFKRIIEKHILCSKSR